MKNRTISAGLIAASSLCLASAAESLWHSDASTSAPLTLLSEADAPNLWKEEVGDGFEKRAHHAGFFAGAGLGTRTFGSRHRHDMALCGVDYGWIISDVKGEGKWYRGNWELRGELFGGSQLNPELAYVIGAAPFLRYDFATGTPFVPFFEAGAGLTATDIRQDLSTVFEFNVQTGCGVQWFLRKTSRQRCNTAGCTSPMPASKSRTKASTPAFCFSDWSGFFSALQRTEIDPKRALSYCNEGAVFGASK